MTLTLLYRFYAVLYAALVCTGFALLTACNPVPLSVVASDFSINGVKGTNTTTASTTTASTTTGTGTSAATSTTTGTNTVTGTTASSTTGTGTSASTTTGTTTAGTTTAGTGTSTGSGQAVTIDLTTKETCSTLTSLVAKVELDEGVTISPDPAVARDYTSPVAFTVTETYGTKIVYTVTVKGKSCVATTSTTPSTPTAPRTDCSKDAIASTGYSLVFKACDTGFSNTASYYDKTECVRDNAKGLIWEGKTTSGLRSVDNKYNNLDSTSLLQIAANTVPSTGAVLPARSPTQVEIDAPNNSIGYKNTVNALNLCGFKDWRMPTKDELQSLLLPGTPSNATQIDLTWFSNTNFSGYYASSTPFGTQVERSSVVQFGPGTVDNLLRYGTVWDTNSRAIVQTEHSVRLVRSVSNP
jgi:hypothetical protein